MLAMSAARPTPCRSSSDTHRAPSSAAVPGASHSRRAATASDPPPSGASSSRKRDEKKWMWASLIISSSKPQDLDLYPGAVNCHPGYAWPQAEAPGARGAGVDDEPLAGALDERLVGVAEHDDVGSVSRQQLLSRRTADFVSVTDVDGASIELEIETPGESRLT